MRLLHTADWHLGHQLYDHPRDHEHAAFLAWLLDTLAAQEVDALLVAGDIFDAAIPPAQAQRRWHDFLIDAWRRLPDLQIVAIAGNHDHAQRLEASAPLLDALGRLHVVGAPDPDRMLVELHGRDGAGALVAAVPYLRPVDLPLGCDALQGVAQVYSDVMARARKQLRPGQALIAMGHCYMVGGAISDLSERRIQRGNQDALPVEIFPEDLAYVALGHLHLAQAVGGRENVRYAGSPLPLAMSERDYRHAVTLIEVRDGRMQTRQSLAVPRAVELLRIPEQGALPLQAVLDAVRALPARATPQDNAREIREPFVELQVLVDRPQPGMKEALLAAAASRAVRVVRIGSTYAGTGGSLGDDAPDVPSLDDLAPADVFVRKWQRLYSQAPDPAALQCFEQLLGMAAAPAAAEAERDRRRVAAGLAPRQPQKTPAPGAPQSATEA